MVYCVIIVSADCVICWMFRQRKRPFATPCRHPWALLRIKAHQGKFSVVVQTLCVIHDHLFIAHIFLLDAQAGLV